MTARRPSKPWRLVVSSPDGPICKPQHSETAARDAAESEKQTTTADRINMQKWDDGRWDEWLRWVRTDSTWHAK
ncbi:hypothetical protein AB0N50_31725 [Streptomyces pharetrae]|jgi:predicted alpha/beta hydrolase family esterase|uniref:hypothetical protein n=1 Tax=Streptomyces pharetrae TaxID=291370 RepID=UPI00346018D1